MVGKIYGKKYIREIYLGKVTKEKNDPFLGSSYEVFEQTVISSKIEFFWSKIIIFVTIFRLKLKFASENEAFVKNWNFRQKPRNLCPKIEILHKNQNFH